MWDTEDRLGFPVRQNRFVLELDGGVVVPETRGIRRKYLKILGVVRGQQLGLTAGTDFLWTPYNV